MKDLTLKYRPSSFDQVIGQEEAIKSMASIKTLPAAILLSGPSGVGKTTIARILANQLSLSILEVNGANTTSVDDARNLIEQVSFRPLDGKEGYAVIIDETHRLSKQAFDSLLKPIEEPPRNVHWILCSTEPNKIPKTIQTRCHRYDLKPVATLIIAKWLENIGKQEGFKLPAHAHFLLASHSQGSPRQALVYLSMCRNCTTDAEIVSLIKKYEEGPPAVLALCRAVVAQNWSDVIKATRELVNEDLESVRLAVLGYASKALINGATGAQAEQMLQIISCFSGSIFSSSEKMAPLLLACGKVCF